MGFVPFAPALQNSFKKQYGTAPRQTSAPQKPPLTLIDNNKKGGYEADANQTIGGFKVVNEDKVLRDKIRDQEVELEGYRRKQEIDNKNKLSQPKELPTILYDTVMQGPQTIEQFKLLGETMKNVDESQLGPNSEIKQNLISKVPIFGKKLNYEYFGDKIALEKSIGLVAKPWGRQLEGGRTTDTDYGIYLKLFTDSNEPKALREYGYNNAYRALVTSYNNNLETLKKLKVDTGDLTPYEVPPPAVLPSAYKNSPSVKILNEFINKSVAGVSNQKTSNQTTIDIKTLKPEDLDGMNLEQLNELEKQLTKTK